MSSDARADETTQADTTARPQSQRRWWRIVLVAVVALTLIATIALRTPSPVGHWDGAAGQDRFREAYATAFEAMPTPTQTLDVRTGYGIARVYRFEGTGQITSPVVLLPGTMSSTPVWADNMQGLLQIGDVYSLDLLGEAGMSIQDRPINTHEQQAEWLHQTLAALPEDSFHIVGLSIGGWTAVNLALHKPQHIASLTLIDPIHTFGDMPLETIMRSIPAAVPWVPKSWRDAFNSYTAGDAPVEDVPVATMIEAGMQHYHMRLPQPSRISEEQLRGIHLPVLAIIAGKSVMHDREPAAETPRRALTKGTVRFYADASHAINGEQPDDIAADIARFIATQG